MQSDSKPRVKSEKPEKIDFFDFSKDVVLRKFAEFIADDNKVDQALLWFGHSLHQLDDSNVDPFDFDDHGERVLKARQLPGFYNMRPIDVQTQAQRVFVDKVNSNPSIVFKINKLYQPPSFTQVITSDNQQSTIPTDEVRQRIAGMLGVAITDLPNEELFLLGSEATSLALAT